MAFFFGTAFQIDVIWGIVVDVNTDDQKNDALTREKAEGIIVVAVVVLEMALLAMALVLPAGSIGQAFFEFITSFQMFASTVAAFMMVYRGGAKAAPDSGALPSLLEKKPSVTVPVPVQVAEILIFVGGGILLRNPVITGAAVIQLLLLPAVNRLERETDDSPLY